jgi:hypothetical protein
MFDLMPNILEVIDYFAWPVIACHFPYDNYVFQDDNVPVHRTRVVNEYMEETDKVPTSSYM